MDRAEVFSFVDVSVRSGGAEILSGITATVRDGATITCVLGPSGSGKSTLLRLCNRLEVPSSGVVRFRGEDIGNADPRVLRRRVGMVFQRPTLFPGTVSDNLAVAAPESRETERVELLERVRLGAEFLTRDGDSLSGGEAQRLCLARTLIAEPQALLMDEPTSALDPAATRGLESLGRDLAGAGLPIMWVTHDLGQAERIADERIVLQRGRIADEHQVAHYLAGEDGDHDHPGDANGRG